MAEKKFNGQITLGWGSTFTMGTRTPAIGNRIFSTYADAFDFANDYSTKGTAVPGLVLSVIEDTDELNGAYFIKSIGSADANAVLEKVGSGKVAESAATFTEATEIATAENLGKIIYVKEKEFIYEPISEEEIPEGVEAEEVEDIENATEDYAKVGEEYFKKVTYSDGPYIVTGEGSIAPLSVSLAGEPDLTREVSSLQGKVSNNEKAIETIEDALVWQGDDEE